MFAGFFEGACLVIRDKEDLLPCNCHFEIRLFLPITISGLFQKSCNRGRVYREMFSVCIFPPLSII